MREPQAIWAALKLTSAASKQAAAAIAMANARRRTVPSERAD